MYASMVDNDDGDHINSHKKNKAIAKERTTPLPCAKILAMVWWLGGDGRTRSSFYEACGHRHFECRTIPALQPTV